MAEKYSLSDVCEKMLDNANVEYNFSLFPSISLTFVVAGQVDGAYWKVTFDLSSVVDLWVSVDFDPEATARDSYLVLKTKVGSHLVGDLPQDLGERFDSLSSEESIYCIEVGHDSDFDLRAYCRDFDWQLSKLSYDEYSRENI